MATIRVTCPTCGKLLEVDAAHTGQEVECGECLQVFVAEPHTNPAIETSAARDMPARNKPKPWRRRGDDDDYEHDHEDDEYDEFDRSTGARPASGTAVAALVVGVLALLTSCCVFSGVPLGVTAMVLGSSAKKNTGPSGAATAATVLGSVACLISLGFVAWLIAVGLRRGGN